MKIHLIDVDTKEGMDHGMYDPMWDGHDNKYFICMKDPKAINDFKNLLKWESSIITTMNSKLVGKGFCLNFKRVSKQGILLPKRSRNKFDNYFFFDILEECMLDKWEIWYTTVQNFCYDPMQMVLSNLADKLSEVYSESYSDCGINIVEEP